MSKWLKLPTTAGTTKISDTSTMVKRMVFGDPFPTLGAALTFLDGLTAGGTLDSADAMFAMAVGTPAAPVYDLGFWTKGELWVAHGTEAIYLTLSKTED